MLECTEQALTLPSTAPSSCRHTTGRTRNRSPLRSCAERQPRSCKNLHVRTMLHIWQPPTSLHLALTCSCHHVCSIHPLVRLGHAVEGQQWHLYPVHYWQFKMESAMDALSRASLHCTRVLMSTVVHALAEFTQLKPGCMYGTCILSGSSLQPQAFCRTCMSGQGSSPSASCALLLP